MLQEERSEPLGESKAAGVDCACSATARTWRPRSRGRFREDLFYRLNVVRLAVPPLRERPKDIPLLVDHFLARFRDTLGKPVRGISDEALERLVAYRWPGNVRELENVIERAIILASSDRIGLSELPQNVVVPQPGAAAPGRAPEFSLRRARRMVELEVIQRALRATGGNRTHAARLLEISHRALLYKLKEHGIRG